MEHEKQNKIACIIAVMVSLMLITGCDLMNTKSEKAVKGIKTTERSKFITQYPWKREKSELDILYQNLKNIPPGMRIEQIIQILGIPDDARPIGRKVSSEPDKGFFITYYISLMSHLPNMNNKQIYLWFDPEGILKEISKNE